MVVRERPGTLTMMPGNDSRFAMFCGQRTGSTSIWLLLKNVTGANILHEPFHPEGFNAEETDVVERLDEIYQGCIAFKHMHEHLPRHANLVLLGQLRVKSVPVLFFRRRDLVIRAISREIALKTNHWMKYPDRQCEYLELVRKSPLSKDGIARRIEHDRREEHVYSGAMADMETLDVFYEDIFTGGGSSQREHIKRLCSHIGFPVDEDLNADLNPFRLCSSARGLYGHIRR